MDSSSLRTNEEEEKQPIPDPAEISGIRVYDATPGAPDLAAPGASHPTAHGAPSRAERSPAAEEAILTRDQFLVLAEAEQNPHAAAIEQASAGIAAEVGLLQPSSRRRFDAFNSLVRYVYPHASEERAIACATWCNWLFFFDDLHDEDPRTSLDLRRARRHMEHQLQLLLGEIIVDHPGPFERLTLEFRARALALAGGAWLRRFGQVVHDYLFSGVLPAVQNWRFRQTPSLAEYIEQREHDSAVMTAIDLIELAFGISIPDSVRNSRAMVEARRACVRTIAFFNDIVSYPKEVLRHKNPNNLVHVLMNERRISLRAALHEATDITNDAAYELLRAERRITRGLPEGPHPVRTYLRAMRAWQRGNIDSSLEGERYASRWSPFAELTRPRAS